MNISRNSVYKNQAFAFGALRRTYQNIVKGQLGEGWSRSIEANFNFEDGTRHTKKIQVPDLDTIHGIGPVTDSITFNFTHRVPDKHEFVIISTRDNPRALYLFVSAETVDRRDEIENTFKDCLSLIQISENEAWQLSDSFITIKNLEEIRQGENARQKEDIILPGPPSSPALPIVAITAGPPPAEDFAKLSLAQFFQRLSVDALWKMGGIAVAVIIGTFTVGRYSVTLEPPHVKDSTSAPASSSKTPHPPAKEPAAVPPSE